MAKDREEQSNKDKDAGAPVFDLEDILAEFGHGSATRGASASSNVLPFPSVPDEEDEMQAEAPPPQRSPAAAPAQDPPPDEDSTHAPAPHKPAATPEKSAKTEEKVLFFPEDDTPPLQAGLEQLKRKAEAYADQMFAEEGKEVSDETIRFERLIPGVDEEAPAQPLRERKARPAPQPPPDLPPEQLAQRYSRGLSLLRLRAVLVFLVSVLLLWLDLAPFWSLPLPASLAEHFPLQVITSAILLLVAMILSVDIWARGLVQLFLLRPGVDTLAAFSCLLTLADAFTQLRQMPERDTLPYGAAAAASLFCCMWGTYAKRQAQRQSCKTAASAAEPYLVTLDPRSWNGQAAYAKWSGPVHGFGSQMQQPDGTQRAYQRAAPLLLLGCLLCGVMVSVAQGASSQLIWSLSALFTAATPLSGMLIFARPYRALARRLSSVGAALAGWPGAAELGTSILLTDTDLFPPGTVTPNGIKIFGDFSVEKVVGVCATLIRESGCGLDKLFHDLLRAHGAVYRRCKTFQRHEGGGLSAEIRGEQILVGSASFMALMEVPTPQGLRVHNAVFCAIDGTLAGVFALNYVLHGTIPPAISSLVSAHISPVLATRDFNLIPTMLRQKFKLPAEKMDFPSVERRTELSSPHAEHGECITAVLCREGLGPFAEAVVGAKRLRGAVRVATALSILGSIAGLLLAFYLTYLSAWHSITSAQMVLFQFAWLVPTLLISAWVTRY